jgi:tRNA-2-methylthio-N6-dimethylallyladenosine synthase
MRVYVHTHGCQINEHDSVRILRAMRSAGYEAAARPEEADLIIFNSCSVREKAEQKLYSALGRLRELKQQRRDMVVGVGGCVAQQEKEELLRRFPHLDLVFGTHNIHRLPAMVEEVRQQRRRPVETEFYTDPFYLEDPTGAIEVHGPKAYVPIMQGCNKVCSFCVVPYVRGREVSRPSASILREARELARRGVKEVMLLGQNVNSYGKGPHGDLSFPELLARINDIDGIERIRFTTSHPQDLSPELIEAYARLEKLCHHLHLPVQSGSDTVLARMRRGYTRREYEERIERLRDRCPDVSLTTDIIVGFPGETEAEFEQTLEIVERIAYDASYSFAYSPRPHTIAAKLYPDDVADEIKKARLSRVQRLQEEISLRRNREKVGAVEEVLIEGRAKLREGQLTGRTRGYRVVNLVAPEELVGRTVKARIVHASANSLLGEVLDIGGESL